MQMSVRDLMALEAQRKDKERQQEEVNGELNRFTTQEMVRGFCLFEEALLVLKAQEGNLQWFTEVATAIQNAIQCYCVIYEK